MVARKKKVEAGTVDEHTIRTNGDASADEPLDDQAHHLSRVERFREAEDRTVSVGRKPVSVGAIIRLVGILVFFALMGLIVYFIWPHLKLLTQEGGVEQLMDQVEHAGPAGVFIILGLQILQIIVAFIPGEFTQIAAGLLYGPWLGTLVIIVGCLIASSFVFLLVKKLGLPFVQSMVPAKWIDKIDQYERSGRLKTIVFILFLIPGLPKDILTYIVPLTGMRLREFLTFSTLGRLPAAFVSAYLADSIMDGDYTKSVIIFAIVALVALVAILSRNKIMGLMDHLHRSHDEDE